MVSAIVLAGGWATRLRPLSLTKPKPLFPVLGRPILDYILDSLDRAGISEVYLSLRVMSDKVMKYVEESGRKINFIVEEEPLGDLRSFEVHQRVDYKLDDASPRYIWRRIHGGGFQGDAQFP